MSLIAKIGNYFLSVAKIGNYFQLSKLAKILSVAKIGSLLKALSKF